MDVCIVWVDGRVGGLVGEDSLEVILLLLDARFSILVDFNSAIDNACVDVGAL